MRNVTVSLDEETALWARLEAARRDISVSSLVRQLLIDSMGGQVDYEDAKVRYLARPASTLSTLGARSPDREELHGRADLR